MLSYVLKEAKIVGNVVGIFKHYACVHYWPHRHQYEVKVLQSLNSVSNIFLYSVQRIRMSRMGFHSVSKLRTRLLKDFESHSQYLLFKDANDMVIKLGYHFIPFTCIESLFQKGFQLVILNNCVLSIFYSKTVSKPRLQKIKLIIKFLMKNLVADIEASSLGFIRTITTVADTIVNETSWYPFWFNKRLIAVEF